jgi:hypothetical protein
MVQLAQLKIDFEDVELEEFFSIAGQEHFDMGEGEPSWLRS